jgi:carbamoyl-phosphate synthase large subunit
MAIAYDHASLQRFFSEAIGAQANSSNPVLIDQFIEDAFEVDVDCVADGVSVIMAGVMQHIEQAGIHSGDSACVLPPYKIGRYHESIMRDYCERLGNALQVKGLMNVQFAIKDDIVYVIEVNPRASRTVPFVSKATGVRVAQIAAKVQAGMTLAELGLTKEPEVSGFFVKEVVLPFDKLPGADTRLGPEMRSTGEAMGMAESFGHAFAKAQLAVGTALPTRGAVLITVNDFDKSAILRLARQLHGSGFTIWATEGTADALERIAVPVQRVAKASDPSAAGHTTVELIGSGKIHLIINTPLGQQSQVDGQALRAAAIRHRVPLLTTLSAAQAAVNGIRALQQEELSVNSLQAHHGQR